MVEAMGLLPLVELDSGVVVVVVPPEAIVRPIENACWNANGRLIL